MKFDPKNKQSSSVIVAAANIVRWFGRFMLRIVFIANIALFSSLVLACFFFFLREPNVDSYDHNDLQLHVGLMLYISSIPYVVLMLIALFVLRSSDSSWVVPLCNATCLTVVYASYFIAFSPTRVPELGFFATSIVGIVISSLVLRVLPSDVVRFIRGRF